MVAKFLRYFNATFRFQSLNYTSTLDFIDNKLAQFILSGSSAQKLKHGQHINLLPGRVVENVANYVEEEIREEALARNIGSFSRFLKLLRYCVKFNLHYAVGQQK